MKPLIAAVLAWSAVLVAAPAAQASAPDTAPAVVRPAPARIQIEWWHSMGGALGDWVNELARDFNASQSTYRVVPSFHGNYDESMSAAIAAYRAGRGPHVLQVFEVGTATMMASRGAVVPVARVMRDAGHRFDARAYLPAVASYYTAPGGQMLSFPFNASTTVFHYNRDAFRRAGLDPDRPPSTWAEVGEAARRLKAAGQACPFTTSWFSWTQLESFSTWHNVEFATRDNGLGGTDSRLAFDTPLHRRHLEHLADLSRRGLFVYKGRGNAADASFVSGECAMLIGSSALYGSVRSTARFSAGIAALPHYPDVAGAPQNTVLGGGSLWVMAGHSPREYRGVAAFFAYLSRPDVAARSHQRTGYLPVTRAAYELTRRSGFYRQHAGVEVAVAQMLRKTTPRSCGVRLGNFVQVRAVIDEEMEDVWAGRKTAREGLRAAIDRGNRHLELFEQRRAE